jgi:hypothetical protein
MYTKRYATAAALAALMFASQPLLAQQAAVAPVQGAVEAIPAGQPPEGQVEAIVVGQAAAPAQQQEMAGASGGMNTAVPEEAAGEQGEANESQGMAMNPGMQQPGKKGCRMDKGGMMGMGMMQGGMGKGGMMHGGMGNGCRMSACAEHAGISKRQYRELMGRLDVLEARMEKIDAMLERLLER